MGVLSKILGIKKNKKNKKHEYGGYYDGANNLHIFKAKNIGKKREADYFIQDTEGLPDNANDAINYLESGGYFKRNKKR